MMKALLLTIFIRDLDDTKLYSQDDGGQLQDL